MNNSIAVVDYDPNLLYFSGDISQTISLTFAQWKYRKTIEVTVKGNYIGISVIKTALKMVYVALPQYSEGVAMMIMADPLNGHSLHNNDDDMRGTRWLEDMLISSEITSFTYKEKSAS
ncbi:DUF5406 family protein [Yersinia ruckeri]